MKEALDRLLASVEPAPALVDVGASGGAPSIWEPIARHCILVGFDPDLREMREVANGKYRRAVTVNEAVVVEGSGGEARFYFTRLPYCSSTLRPDARALSDYAFDDCFVVEREGNVRASRLDAILDRLAIDRVDWLKLDTQGTDLRIFKSLREEMRTRVLAVDVEPGLIDAYAGEDHFIDVHRELTADGFWLSRLDVRGAARINRKTREGLLSAEGEMDADYIGRVIRPSPGWCECRYFRTIDSLARRTAPRRDYILLAIFAMLDAQWGFVLDLARAGEGAFGASEQWSGMRTEAIRAIKKEETRRRRRRALALPARIARRLLKRRSG